MSERTAIGSDYPMKWGTRTVRNKVMLPQILQSEADIAKPVTTLKACLSRREFYIPWIELNSKLNQELLASTPQKGQINRLDATWDDTEIFQNKASGVENPKISLPLNISTSPLSSPLPSKIKHKQSRLMPPTLSPCEEEDTTDTLRDEKIWRKNYFRLSAPRQPPADFLPGFEF